MWHAQGCVKTGAVDGVAGGKEVRLIQGEGVAAHRFSKIIIFKALTPVAALIS